MALILSTTFIHSVLADEPNGQTSTQIITEIEPGPKNYAGNNVGSRNVELFNWSEEICLTQGPANSTRPSMFMDNLGNLHLGYVYSDEVKEWLGTDFGDIIYQISTNGGNNWSEQRPLPLIYCNVPANVEIVYNKDSGAIHLAYVDLVYAKFPTFHLSSSYDLGETWDKESLGGDIGWLPHSSYTLDMVSSREYEHIAALGGFRTASGTSDILSFKENSTDGSSTTFNGDSYFAIGSSGGNVYLLWSTESGLNFSSSSDNGTTWSSPETVSPLTATTLSLLVNDDDLYTVWANDSPGNYELYLKMGNDDVSWSQDVRLTYATGSSICPSLSLDSRGNIDLVWQDNRDGNWEIYYKKIDSNGSTIVNDTRLCNSTSNSQYPKVVTDGDDYVYVVWQDDRNGCWDIYFRRFPANDVTPPVVKHEPIVSAYLNETVAVNTTVTDNFGVEYVILHYGDRMNNITQSLELNLTVGTDKNGTWNTQFTPSDLGNRTIFYYIEASDSQYKPKTPIFLINIVGNLPRFIQCLNTTANTCVEIEIETSIENEFGINYAVLFYKETTHSEYSNVTMKLVSGSRFFGLWNGTIPFQNESCTITYYVEAYSGTVVNTTEIFTLEVRSIQNLGDGEGNAIYILIGIVMFIVSTIIILSLRKTKLVKRKEE